MYLGEGEDYAYHITAYMNIFSQSLSWGRDWNLGVQLTLFQLVGRGGGNYAHHITTYMKVTYV